MFVPRVFSEDNPKTINTMIDRAGLPVLITHGPGGLFASHLPVFRKGELFIGHLARKNPHRDRTSGGEALLIFSGPDAYVSPSWYPSKAKHGREVPTWDYEAVHVYGKLTWVDEPQALIAIVNELTQLHERGRSKPWSIREAPAEFIERLLRGIVGVELRQTRIEAKRKLSQNKKKEDRNGVANALGGEAPTMAELIRKG